MKSWEVEIELRVRKTLHLSGPVDAGAVRAIIDGAINHGGTGIEMFQKVEADGRGYYRPVERAVGNDPVIISVQEIVRD